MCVRAISDDVCCRTAVGGRIVAWFGRTDLTGSATRSRRRGASLPNAVPRLRDNRDSAAQESTDGVP